MNTNGIFVAPTPGKYFFSYSGLSSRSVLGRVELQVKTATYVRFWVLERNKLRGLAQTFLLAFFMAQSHS
jgi:hypothetical protein